MTTAVSDLNAELSQLRGDFLQAKADFAALVEGLDDAQFNWRPGEDEWSAAECIDHLVALGTLMVRRIDEGIEQGESRGLRGEGPYKYGALGNWFVRAVGPEREGNIRKFKAPAAYAPTSNHSISRLEKAFCELQDEFVARVERANGLDLGRIKLPSPVTSLLKISLGQWFALLAGHQQRHFQQAQRAKTAMLQKAG